MPDYRQEYENGKYPPCFVPHPPFYGICIKGIKHVTKKVRTHGEDWNRKKCTNCIQRHRFCGYEHLGYSGEESAPSNRYDPSDELIGRFFNRTINPPFWEGT